MKKLLGLLLLPTVAWAQPALHTPVPFAGFEFLNRKSVYSHADMVEEGTYLFPAQATPAFVKLKNGRTYTNIMAMLNLLDNEMLFQDSLGQVYTAITPIDIVVFDRPENKAGKTMFKTGFPVVDGLTENTYYEVLSEGKLTLLKAYKVAYTDRTTIQSSVPIRRYDTKEVFYVYDKKNGMRKISKTKDSVLETVQDKSKEMLDYIQTHKPSFKSDLDLAGLFDYYNKLSAPAQSTF